MKRRDFFKGMVAAGVTAQVALGEQAAPGAAAAQQVAPLAPTAPAIPGPVPWMTGLKAVKPLPVTNLAIDALASPDAQFFSEKQMASLRRLCDLYMPEDDQHPGAAEAGTPEFLDFLIGASPADRQQSYQSGLDRLEAEATKKFSVGFAETNDTQADELIKPWLRAWMADHPPVEPYARFINVAHSDIRVATMNSQAWNDALRLAGRPGAELDTYWYPIDPDLQRASRTAAHRPSARTAPAAKAATAPHAN